MAGAAALGAASLLAVLGALRGDAGVRSTGRTGTVAAAGAATETRASAELAPFGVASLAVPTLTLTASYAPLLRVLELERGSSTDVLHRGTVSLALAPRPRWTGALAATWAAGTADPLLDPQQPGLDSATAAVTSTSGLSYRSLAADVQVAYALSPRTAARAEARWFTSGGTERDTPLPVQRGVLASLALWHELTLRDRVGGTFTATGTDTAAAPRTLGTDATRGAFASAEGTWRRRLGPESDGWAALGVGLLSEEDDRTRSDLRPAASAELGIDAAAPRLGLRARVAARSSVAVNRATGRAEEIAHLQGLASWSPSARWSLALSAGLASPWDRLDRASTASGELRAGWRPRDRFAIEAGVSAWRQRDDAAPVPEFRHLGSFVAIAFGTQRSGGVR